MGGRRVVTSHLVRGALVVGFSFLAACGGSDSSTSEAIVDGDASVVSTIAGEVSYTEFCASADANNSKLPQIESTDDAAAITTKINALAAALSDTASKAPAEVKSAADKVAAAAQAMADSLKSDPSLDSFDAVVAKYATPEIDAATESINKLVSEKCGASK